MPAKAQALGADSLPKLWGVAFWQSRWSTHGIYSQTELDWILILLFFNYATLGKLQLGALVFLPTKWE